MSGKEILDQEDQPADSGKSQKQFARVINYFVALLILYYAIPYVIYFFKHPSAKGSLYLVALVFPIYFFLSEFRRLRKR